MHTTLNFLIIEDDEIEVLKLRKVFDTLGYRHQIFEAENGKKALEILNKKLPDVILLDLNMPKMSGLEFLKELRSNEHLKYIPAVVLTTSNNHQDIFEANKIGIEGYLLKPLNYKDYIATIKSIVEYWSNNQLIKPKKEV